ncbi:uncharacterized protein B0H64DRAFT_411597, partial [Chaetomium fimeti]
MLHEILLSLSGHPSPLLRSASSNPTNALTTPERALLSSLAHLSDLHIHLLTSTAHTATAHPSVICRAVASATDVLHLAAFRRKVRVVEETLLRKDAALVGAYDIVPLTAVGAEFVGWGRRLEWLGRVLEIMVGDGGGGGREASAGCTGGKGDRFFFRRGGGGG